MGRFHASADAIEVHAIAGTHCVLLAISAPDADALGPAFLGFAISKASGGERLKWLGQGLGQEEPADEAAALQAELAQLAVGETSATDRNGPTTRSAAAEASAMAHPICSFQWGDYEAVPDTEHTYSVWRVHASAASHARRLEGPTTVVVRTERETGAADGSEVHFNRGAAGSQGYVRRFGSAAPRERRVAGSLPHSAPRATPTSARPGEPAAQPSGSGPSPWTWLSRGLEEALLRFLGRALGTGWAIRGACYELTYGPVLQALAAARDRGADVSVVYDSKPASWHAERREWMEHGPSAANDAAVRSAGVGDITRRRAAALSSISHNKFFLLLLPGGEPAAVWTGSTNITTSGIFGHLNVGHVCADRAIARRYLSYWEELATDPALRSFRPFNSALSPVPPLEEHTSTVLFSPRDSDASLRFYSDLIRSAGQGVFLTAAFGLSAAMAEGLLHAPAGSLDKARGPLSPEQLERHGTPTYLLLDNEGRGSSPHFVRAVRGLPHGHVAVGSHLPIDGIVPGHEAERLSELNKHVAYVHTKFALIDPLSPRPTVVTGSANFSMASTKDNDENMLVLRGDGARRVAELYLVEFMRAFRHFSCREAVLARVRRESGVDLRHAAELSEEQLQRARATVAGGRPEGGAGEGGMGGARLAASFRPGSRLQVERLLFMGATPAGAEGGSSGEDSNTSTDFTGGRLSDASQPDASQSATGAEEVVAAMVETAVATAMAVAGKGGRQ